MKFVYFLTLIIFFIMPLPVQPQNTDKQKLDELAADSASLDRAVRYLKNPELKKRVEFLLNEVITEKRKHDYYPVDFYYSRGSKNQYTANQSITLTLDQLADSLQSAVDLAKIMRINKIDFYRFLLADSSGSKDTTLYSAAQDNHFVELDSFPIYRQQEFLKQIFLETVLSTDKKRSLEFIWGRSEENDAFYSTKLTAFNGQFSVYPKYRTFIGLDSFRGKKNWFYNLAVYAKPKYLDTLTIGNQAEITAPVDTKSDSTINKIQVFTPIAIKHPVQTDSVKIEPPMQVLTVSKDTVQVTEKSFSVSLYDKQRGVDSYQLKYEANLNSVSLYDSLKTVLKAAKFLKIEKNNTAMQKNLSVGGQELIELNGVMNNQNRMNLILNTITSNPDNRHSVEWITGRGTGGSTYFATVITAFDGQLTVFNNYKKIADRSAQKDKNSWFNRLPVQNPE